MGIQRAGWREEEVLALLAAGLSTAEIAERCYLAPKTVRHHLTAVSARLGGSRIGVARRASQPGINRGEPQRSPVEI